MTDKKNIALTYGKKAVEPISNTPQPVKVLQDTNKDLVEMVVEGKKIKVASQYFTSSTREFIRTIVAENKTVKRQSAGQAQEIIRLKAEMQGLQGQISSMDGKINQYDSRMRSLDQKMKTLEIKLGNF